MVRNGEKWCWMVINIVGIAIIIAVSSAVEVTRKEMNFPIEEKLTKKSEINIVVTEVLNKNEC